EQPDEILDIVLRRFVGDPPGGQLSERGSNVWRSHGQHSLSKRPPPRYPCGVCRGSGAGSTLPTERSAVAQRSKAALIRAACSAAWTVPWPVAGEADGAREMTRSGRSSPYA